VRKVPDLKDNQRFGFAVWCEEDLDLKDNQRIGFAVWCEEGL
jgi:hypothetical protein